MPARRGIALCAILAWAAAGAAGGAKLGAAAHLRGDHDDVDRELGSDHRGAEPPDAGQGYHPLWDEAKLHTHAHDREPSPRPWPSRESGGRGLEADREGAAAAEGGAAAKPRVDLELLGQLLAGRAAAGRGQRSAEGASADQGSGSGGADRRVRGGATADAFNALKRDRARAGRLTAWGGLDGLDAHPARAHRPGAWSRHGTLQVEQESSHVQSPVPAGP